MYEYITGSGRDALADGGRSGGRRYRLLAKHIAADFFADRRSGRGPAVHAFRRARGCAGALRLFQPGRARHFSGAAGRVGRRRQYGSHDSFRLHGRRGTDDHRRRTGRRAQERQRTRYQNGPKDHRRTEGQDRSRLPGERGAACGRRPTERSTRRFRP